jgi:hypothetical protein
MHGTGVGTKNAGVDKKSTNRVGTPVYVNVLFLDMIIFCNEIISYNNCAYNNVFYTYKPLAMRNWCACFKVNFEQKLCEAFGKRKNQFVFKMTFTAVKYK